MTDIIKVGSKVRLTKAGIEQLWWLDSEVDLGELTLGVQESDMEGYPFEILIVDKKGFGNFIPVDSFGFMPFMPDKQGVYLIQDAQSENLKEFDKVKLTDFYFEDESIQSFKPKDRNAVYTLTYRGDYLYPFALAELDGITFDKEGLYEKGDLFPSIKKVEDACCKKETIVNLDLIVKVNNKQEDFTATVFKNRGVTKKEPKSDFSVGETVISILCGKPVLLTIKNISVFDGSIELSNGEKHSPKGYLHHNNRGVYLSRFMKREGVVSLASLYGVNLEHFVRETKTLFKYTKENCENLKKLLLSDLPMPKEPNEVAEVLFAKGYNVIWAKYSDSGYDVARATQKIKPFRMVGDKFFECEEGRYNCQWLFIVPVHPDTKEEITFEKAKTMIDLNPYSLSGEYYVSSR